MFKNETGADNAAAPGEKISRELAEKEFNTFCDNNGIEHDESVLDTDDIETFKEIKKQFLAACIKGRVEVDGRDLKYTISEYSPDGFKGEVVTIKRPKGSAFSAMDSSKDREGIKKLHQFISAQTGKDVSYFTKIDVLDWKFFQAISQLFLSL